MAQLPTIYTIQASDAPQHTGRLQDILHNLKNEERIGHFTNLGSEDDLSSLSDTIRNNDLILIVLTNQLEAQKERIENSSRNVKANHPEAKIAEIIVDNVVYDNTFITFPADLIPFRDREDKDTAWNSIEQSLKKLFPLKERKKPNTHWWKKIPIPGWWLIAGTLAALLGLVVLFSFFIGDDPHRLTVVQSSSRIARILAGRCSEEPPTSTLRLRSLHAS